MWVSAEIAPETANNQLENNYTNVQDNNADSNDKIPMMNDDVPIRTNSETRKTLWPEKSFFPGHDSNMFPDAGSSSSSNKEAVRRGLST